MSMGLSFDDLRQRMEEQARAEQTGNVRLGEVFETLRSRWRRDRRGCPGDEDLAAYSEARLPWWRRTVVWWHVWGCTLCQTDLAELHDALTATDTPLSQPATFRLPFSLAGIMPRRRLWPWMLAGAQAVVILVLFLRGVPQYGTVARQAHQLRAEVLDAIQEGLQDAAEFDRLLESSKIKETVKAGQQLSLVSLTTNGNAYPFPTWRYQPVKTTTLARGLSQFPDLRDDYEAYLQEWIDIFLDLGPILVNAKKIPEALQIAAYLRRVYPDDKRILFTLGTLYTLAGDHRKAIAVYEGMMARSLAQQDPRPAHYAGWSYARLGDADTALKYYDTALHIDPGYAKALYNKALLLHGQEREQRSRELLDKASVLTLQAYTEEGDANPRIPFTLALIDVARDKLDDALVYLEHALQQDHTYVIRAERELAFEVFRARSNEPSFTKFQSLLDRYRQLPGESNADYAALYDASVFHE